MHTKVEVKMTDAFAATVKEQVSTYSAETKKNKIKEKPWPIKIVAS